jgi:taurine transport system substrate-binding protein
MVAKNGSGINTVADLKGKKIAVPFNSTTHFHTMVALEQAKVNPADVQILNSVHPKCAPRRAATSRQHSSGSGAGRSEKDGKVITSSGQISASTGKATFDGYIANKDWAKANKDFMVKFTKLLADSDAKYRNNTAKWTADSPEVKAVAKWSGAKPEDVPAGMALYRFPTAQDQATNGLAAARTAQRPRLWRRPRISSYRRNRSKKRFRTIRWRSIRPMRQKPRSNAWNSGRACAPAFLATTVTEIRACTSMADFA